MLFRVSRAPGFPPQEHLPFPDVSAVAASERVFDRATGAAPIAGNSVRLLLDARQNYPAWLAAIEQARHFVLFESYIIDDDPVGQRFADALAARARAGVRVFVVYDWLGSLRSGALWPRLRAAGVEVRGFNAPRLASPLGWLARDHRKTIVVDGQIGFASGLCVSSKWEGDPKRGLEPWRDTGVELCGPAVVALVDAFAEVWRACRGPPLPTDLLAIARAPRTVGSVRVRVVAGAPNATGTYRLDLAIAGLAREHLWLTDAYFVGTAAYVQALAAAARDGVDVRLLVPGASDIPVVAALSRAGYRPLLDAGVRVFEWNGSMLHAKSAIADTHWARVGSTNLNFASWMANFELDVAVEDARFADRMAKTYEEDLARATEIVLTRRNRVQAARREAREQGTRRAAAASAGRAAAGALTIGSAVGAALTNRRVLGPAESGLLFKVAMVLLALSAVLVLWPRVLALPLAALGVWVAVAMLLKARALHRANRAPARARAAPPGEL
jgi:cardiolipin synthase